MKADPHLLLGRHETRRLVGFDFAEYAEMCAESLQGLGVVAQTDGDEVVITGHTLVVGPLCEQVCDNLRAAGLAVRSVLVREVG